MDLTSSLHPMDSILTEAALTSCSSLCPQEPPVSGDRLLDRHTCGIEPGMGPEWGLLAPVYLSSEESGEV